jgi:hypothetical protein
VLRSACTPSSGTVELGRLRDLSVSVGEAAQGSQRLARHPNAEAEGERGELGEVAYTAFHLSLN